MNKTVIFDMGGVLVDLDIEDCKKVFRQELGYAGIDQIIDACHQKGIYGDLEEGTLSAEDFRSIVLAESRPGVAPEEVDRAMSHILVGIAPYKVELLKRMVGKYDLCMLSNNNPICLPFSSKMFDDADIPLDEVFRKCYMSFQMKALKPSEAFYKAVLADIGRPSEEIIFIDDSQKNVDGAIAAGMPAVYYEPGTDLSALLADVLEDESLRVEGGC
jgi:putative hydrolase of the HAD superfamily